MLFWVLLLPRPPSLAYSVRRACLMRLALIGLWLVCLLQFDSGSAAEPRGGDRIWIANLVSRVSEVERKFGPNPQSGRVTLRLRIGTAGTLDWVVVEESSGSTDVDERALRAAQAAAPFDPPPKRLLTLEGFTELSFSLQLDARRRGSTPR